MFYRVDHFFSVWSKAISIKQNYYGGLGSTTWQSLSELHHESRLPWVTVRFKFKKPENLTQL